MFLQSDLDDVSITAKPSSQVADAILGNEMFTHYDRPQIARRLVYCRGFVYCIIMNFIY
jgi:hypothetical protein